VGREVAENVLECVKGAVVSWQLVGRNAVSGMETCSEVKSLLTRVLPREDRFLPQTDPHSLTP
jgi:hypothetical protein